MEPTPSCTLRADLGLKFSVCTVGGCCLIQLAASAVTLDSYRNPTERRWPRNLFSIASSEENKPAVSPVRPSMLGMIAFQAPNRGAEGTEALKGGFALLD